MPATAAGRAADFVSDVLAREGEVWVSAASSSMAPFVCAGDALRLIVADAGRLQPGALVAFRRDGALVVHRVLSQTPDGLVTGGDALAAADPPVPWPAVVARIAAVRTQAGRRFDLDRWPWPLIGRALAAVARRGAPNRLAWIARRAPFYLIAGVCR